MSKKSTNQRNKRRIALVAKYTAKRDELRKKSRDLSLSLDERFEAFMQLSSMPRDTSPARVRGRCAIGDGRPRGYMRDFKISRIAFRHLATRGLLPGIVMASW